MRSNGCGCGADGSIQCADSLAAQVPRNVMESHLLAAGRRVVRGLAAAQKYVTGDSIHTSAVMVIQGGEVVDQWGDIDKKIDSYSVRKSLLSALYGIYASEGVIDIN